MKVLKAIALVMVIIFMAFIGYCTIALMVTPLKFESNQSERR